RLGEQLRLDEPARQLVPADGTRAHVVLPARAGEVAAYDALDREHLEPPAFRRPPIGAEGEQVIRDDRARPREPEPRQAGEHAPLVWDLGGEHDVERRDAVAGDEQQPLIVERIELANLPARD